MEAWEAGDIVLRVHFSLETAPEWDLERRAVTGQFFVRCWLSQESLRSAADQWAAEAASFPVREPEPR